MRAIFRDDEKNRNSGYDKPNMFILGHSYEITRSYMGSAGKVYEAVTESGKTEMTFAYRWDDENPDGWDMP